MFPRQFPTPDPRSTLRNGSKGDEISRYRQTKAGEARHSQSGIGLQVGPIRNRKDESEHAHNPAYIQLLIRRDRQSKTHLGKSSP